MGREFGEDAELRRRFTRRALLLGIGQVAAFGAVSGRLYQLQIMDGSRYAPLADDNRLSLELVAPVRGRILDRHGVLIAGNEERFRVLVKPAQAGDINSVLDLLGRIVPMSAETREEVLVKARKGPRSAGIVVASDLSFDQVAEINLLAPQLAGVETGIAYQRTYPLGAALGHVTGHVGMVDKRALDDDPILRIPGIRTGKMGLERGMDVTLRGKAGSRRFEVDARGRTVRSLDDTEPVAGSDVTSSIDVDLQRKVIDRLSREVRAAAAVLDCASGEVLALASWPTFDPSEIAGQISADAWRRLRDAPHKPLLNRAVSGFYPPGSTYKLVTALAALESRATTPKEKINCTGSYTLAGQTYRCWHRQGHGRVDLHEAVTRSCDFYFYEMAKRVGSKRLAAMARRLGFGDGKCEGLHVERGGIVPDPDWKRWTLGEGWSTGDSLLTGIGQGFVLANPLQLAVMTARVATGRAVVPTLVKRGRGASGQLAGQPPLALDQSSLEALRRGMQAVVNDGGGTGAAARPSGGVTIAGKTGTSQVRRLREDEDSASLPWDQRDHALFVAYFPAEAPRFAISAVVEHGGGGGTTAAPLVRDIVEMLIARDPLEEAPASGADPVERAGLAPELTQGRA